MCLHIESLNIWVLDLESLWKVHEFEVDQGVGTLLILLQIWLMETNQKINLFSHTRWQCIELYVLTDFDVISLGFQGETKAHHLICLCLCCCVGEGNASGAGEWDSEPDRASRSNAAALSANHQHSCVGSWTRWWQVSLWAAPSTSQPFFCLIFVLEWEIYNMYMIIDWQMHNVTGNKVAFTLNFISFVATVKLCLKLLVFK